MKNPKKKKNRVLPILIGAAVLAGAGEDLSAREMTEYPRVKLQSLDKATARTMTFEARVGSTVKFGTLFIKVQTCQKSSPIDQPESAAFLQVWEINEEKKSEWVFSGWMFASSPGLSPMDHPIYDVWLIDCLEDENQKKPEPKGDLLEPQDAQKQVPPVQEGEAAEDLQYLD